MSDWAYAVILGIIEGLTEFIPVSSTGHLLLAKTFMGLPDGFWDTFAVMIQLGAILAVVVLYFTKLWTALIRLPTDPAARRFAISVLIAFAPSVVVGLIAYDVIKQILFESPMVICVSLIVGGVVLLVIDRLAPPAREHDATQLPWLTSLGVGFFQVLAMIPGVSRSGATIVGSMLLGVEKRAAAEFSFFLAIPTMVAAFAKDAWENRGMLDGGHAGVIAVGFVVSFLVAIVVIRAMLAIVTRHGYAVFGWWRIAVGGAGLAALMLR
ncbi:MAG: undecaprenyl-diphosphate phosphatase [Phenylobacterium sp.]|uniref:undecaprenyl-diphosphate phosphatase n=1 Tax=Phenylobacterium sp. TaxID=1871053 RepID=UPI0025F60FEA|nr:undecaprenyl-diphosphate phosphatase [Phenylobacterium sp.]MBI1197638.1 undecaprenyl-diphosphate phosphatase [Phenylobacterium sp.]